MEVLKMSSLKTDFIVKILKVLISNISPDIKKLIQESIDKLDAKAKTTRNPFDDLLALVLKAIFD